MIFFYFFSVPALPRFRRRAAPVKSFSRQAAVGGWGVGGWAGFAAAEQQQRL